MKRKNFLTVATLFYTIIVFALLFAMQLPILFPKSDNVFDRLYYEVIRHEKNSVLLTGTESAYVDHDMGIFMHISIPDLHMILSIEGNFLKLSFRTELDSKADTHSRSIRFRYDIKEKKLYGERPLDYLKENFLSHYFQWHIDAGMKIRFSSDNLGKYTFTLQERIS